MQLVSVRSCALYATFDYVRKTRYLAELGMLLVMICRNRNRLGSTAVDVYPTSQSTTCP